MSNSVMNMPISASTLKHFCFLWYHITDIVKGDVLMKLKLLKKSDTSAELFLEGRLDTNAAPATQDAFMQVAEKYSEIVINFTDLVFISSAGLRAILVLQKYANRTGIDITYTNLKPSVREVFELTGFSGILNIED